MTVSTTQEEKRSFFFFQGRDLPSLHLTQQDENSPDQVRDKLNAFLSSLRHSSVVFDSANDCWDVSILASTGYLWCRLVLQHAEEAEQTQTQSQAQPHSVVVRMIQVEGDSEVFASFTRQLEQVFCGSVDDVSLLTAWMQSISSDEDDPHGFCTPSTSSVLWKKAIEVLLSAVSDDIHVSVGEKLSAVQVLLEVTNSSSPAALDQVISNGLVEAVLTLFTSTPSNTGNLWDDPYLVKPYCVQILHAIVVQNNHKSIAAEVVLAKIERCPAFMDYLHKVTQSSSQIMLNHIVQMSQGILQAVVVQPSFPASSLSSSTSSRKRSFDEASRTITSSPSSSSSLR